MARIKIKDLPKDMKISKEEMKNVVGGALSYIATAELPCSLIPPTTIPITSAANKLKTDAKDFLDRPLG